MMYDHLYFRVVHMNSNLSTQYEYRGIRDQQLDDVRIELCRRKHQLEIPTRFSACLFGHHALHRSMASRESLDGFLLMGVKQRVC